MSLNQVSIRVYLVLKDLLTMRPMAGDNMIALIWNSDKAIAAGATSFTVQLVTDLSQGGDIYSTMSQTFAVDPNGINNAVKFEGLKTGAQFYARARANYPGSRMSDWIYVTSSSDTSSPYLMTVTGKTTSIESQVSQSHIFDPELPVQHFRLSDRCN
jgi:hypothetical protein